jgi:non-heme chloroperoxidase
MPHCAVDEGVELYVEDFGEGDALVFTSAGNLTHKMWDGQVAYLARHFRTVTYDWRGTGQSAKPRGGYTADAAVRDLCRLVENLKLRRVTLVGHGIGSHVAMLAAHARPDLVRSLVLLSTAPWFAGERDGVAGGISAEFLQFLQDREARPDAASIPYAQGCAEMAEQWLFFRPAHPAVLYAVLEQALAWPQFVIESYAQSMRLLDHRALLAALRCPTLILQGRHDRKQRYEGAVYLQQRLPDSRLVTLEQSAHMGQIEELARVNRTIHEFLSTLRADA